MCGLQLYTLRPTPQTFKHKTSNCVVPPTCLVTPLVNSLEGADTDMTSAAVFNIDPSCLTLGHVLARGSANITLYSAKLQIGKNTTQVGLILLKCPWHQAQRLQYLSPGGSEKVKKQWSPHWRRACICGRDPDTAVSLSSLSAVMPHFRLLQA